MKKKDKKELKRLELSNLSDYTVRGTENDWNQALQKNQGIITITR